MRLLPNFVRNLFSRNASRPAPDHDNDWAVGDLAECIKKGKWETHCANGDASGPVYGDVLTVRRAIKILHPVSFRFISVLSFGSYDDCLFSALAFRKITPRADEAERADSVFIEQLKRTPNSPWLPEDPETHPVTPPPPPPLEPKREDA